MNVTQACYAMLAITRRPEEIVIVAIYVPTIGRGSEVDQRNGW